MFRNLLAAALLVAAPVPASAPDAPTVIVQATPVDTTARAKFPKVDAELVDKLAMINRYVNTHIQGASDEEHYGVGEMWVMFPADSKGDCEDYALTKLGILANLGFPAVANAHIIGVMVHFKHRAAEGHAILALRMPDRSIMFLDNRFDEPMTRKELEAQGYEFFDW